MSVATAVNELLELRKALETQQDDVETTLDILEQASKAQVTPHLLHQTSLGRTVASLKKSQHVRVSQRAKEIVLAWKSVVLTETCSSSSSSSFPPSLSSCSSSSITKMSRSPSATSMLARSPSTPSPIPLASPSRSTSCPKLSITKSGNSGNTLTITKTPSTGNILAASRTASSSKLTPTTTNNSNISVPAISFAPPPDPSTLPSLHPETHHAGQSGAHAGTAPVGEEPKSMSERLSDALKTIEEPELHRFDSSVQYKLNSTDSKVRNKIQELVFNAMGEANDLVKIELAVRLEQALFVKHAGANAEYREHSREILGNLRDVNNPMLRFHLLSGAWTTEELVQKSVYDLAGDDLKKQRQEDAAWMDGWRRADWQQANRPKGGCDLFKCAKCGARDTTWTQKQTRSADEPMTTFVLCNNCGKRWRMC